MPPLFGVLHTPDQDLKINKQIKPQHLLIRNSNLKSQDSPWPHTEYTALYAKYALDLREFLLVTIQTILLGSRRALMKVTASRCFSSQMMPRLAVEAPNPLLTCWVQEGFW